MDLHNRSFGCGYHSRARSGDDEEFTLARVTIVINQVMAGREPRGPLQLQIPSVCRFCAAVGRIVLETTMVAESILLRWRCARCRQSWPVTADDITKHDRRVRPTDQ
jgi:hypothetical protein